MAEPPSSEPEPTALAQGRARLASGDAAGAIGPLEAAIQGGEDAPETWFQLGRAHLILEDEARAEAAFAAALQREPAHARAAHMLGMLLASQGRTGEALPWLRLAADQSPVSARAQRDLGTAALILGDLSEARARLTRAVELDPTLDEALVTLVRMTAMAAEGSAAAALLRTLDDLAARLDGLTPAQRVQVLFALAKTQEDRGRAAEAWASLARANAGRRAVLTYDAAAEARRKARVIEAFNPALLRRLGGAGTAGRRPVVIIGMPRSGSTLLEQILSAHPDVHAAGEAPFLMDIALATTGPDGEVFPDWAARMNAVDVAGLGKAFLAALPPGDPPRSRTSVKAIENDELVGLIHLTLPEATILHCRRDPRDVLFSCFSLLFANGHAWTCDWDELIAYWREHEALMTHWRAVLPPGRIVEVGYEALVADFETEARRVLDACGLAWNPAVLAFHEARRPVRTGSLAQVREPIYDRSVGRWRPFAEQLRPIFDKAGLTLD